MTMFLLKTVPSSPLLALSRPLGLTPVLKYAHPVPHSPFRPFTALITETSSHLGGPLTVPWFHIAFRGLLRPSLDGLTLGNPPNYLEMKRFLRFRSLDFRESHACIVIELPRHILLGQSLPPAKWEGIEHALSNVYLNKTTGFFTVPDCGLYGNWTELQNFLSVWCENRTKKRNEALIEYPVLPQFNLETPPEVQEVWDRGVTLSSLSSSEFKDLLKGLKLPVRELKLEDLSSVEVRVDLETQSLLFPIRYHEDPWPLIGLRQIKPSSDANEPFEETTLPEFIPGGGSSLHRVFPFPFGLESARRARVKSIVLVSNILDAVVIRARTKAYPVALAEGFGCLPPDLLAFFEEFDHIKIWFPNERSAFEAGLTFARKLGDKRCFLMNRDVVSPLMCLKKRENIDSILQKQVRPCCHEFITTFESLREDVYMEMAHQNEIEGIKFKRFDQLNEIMRGFRRGELSVFSGKTGTGKTTFMSEYSLDLCAQGVNTLWGSFEVKNTRLAKMQLKQFSAINLEDHLDQFDPWADRFQRLPMYYLTFHGSQKVDLVLDAMGHAVYIYDISHVIIDNIQFMMGMSAKGMDRFYTQDLIIERFRKFATLHNVHVTLVIHPRKENEDHLNTNSIFGGAKATQEADNVILLQEEQVNPKLKRKFIQIAKNRFSGDLGYLPLFFNKGTLTFSKKIFLKDRAKVKKKESPKLEQNNANFSSLEDPMGILPKEVFIPPDYE